jgi:SAM-dependent methyltransferase
VRESRTVPPAAYDEVPYPDFPYEFTQPGRMAALAVMHGLTPPPPATARVLELGCGAGGNVLAIAAERPGVAAHGIDLAERPVAAARATARAAGIDNATFGVGDVRSLSDLGEFDYVIAHGLYAWVPPEVRDAVMAVIAQRLSPHGIAFVSYNAHPGGQLARALRDAALWHVRDLEEPLERGARAAELFGLLEDARVSGGSEAYAGTLARIVHDLADASPQVAHHDILSDGWDPVWFADFAAHAARHGLAYVDEAWPRRPRPPAVTAMLERLGAAGRAEREQYVDILLCRRFRSSLLCRAERAPSDEPDLERLRELRFVAGDAPDGLDVATRRRPEALPFDELGATVEEVWRACGAGAIVPWVGGPPAVHEPGERPRAHALARFQAERGRPLTTLTGTFLRVDDPASRALVALLDGTRDRAAILRDLQGAAGVGLPPEALDANLRTLAVRGLLLSPS